MAWSPKDDSVLSSDGAGALTVATVNKAVRTLTADATLAIGPTDGIILISSAGGSAPGATTETMADGQEVTIAMTAFNTNAYTVTVDEGTLTFNAADECATVFHDGTALRVKCLRGATIV